ncbi:MAG: FAD-dependent oxidoreductase [Pseudomonadota bacterium]
MTARKHDCIVLGAGIVGVSTACQLQMAGYDVVLIDRQPPGQATSFGNAGLIQHEAIVPYMMPRDWRTLLTMARNKSTQAHLHYRAVLRLAPWLWRYWRNSGQRGLTAGAEAHAPLVLRAVAEHESLMAEAGCADMLRRTGYVRLHRDTEDLDADEAEQSRLHDTYGIDFEVKNPDQLEQIEPHLREEFVGGIVLPQVGSIGDPEALTRAYAKLFAERGGRLETGDARTLSRSTNGSGWQVQNIAGPITADHAVIALGPWSGDVLRGLGIDVPLAVKRGYHMHFRAGGNATLNHPLLDVTYGFAMAPMDRGVRVTTGAEFAFRDARPTPVQLEQVEAIARQIFPLAERLDPEPWMGARPCTPDLIPVIGPVPRHKGLWANFGHHHLGLTLGPVTGRLLAQMMKQDDLLTDPTPYAITRF